MIRDKEQERSVIKKANNFISFKFGDVQFLDIMKFLGGANSLDSFLKVYKASETKRFFPIEWFDNPNKFDFPELFLHLVWIITKFTRDLEEKRND